MVKNIKKYCFLSIALIFSIYSTPANAMLASKPASPWRVIITPYDEPAIVTDHDTTLLATSMAIYQQVAPIITRRCILNRILKIRAQSWWNRSQSASIVHALTSTLQDEQWIIFEHDYSDSYLLIPVSYAQRFTLDKTSTNIAIAQMLGFNVNEATVIRTTLGNLQAITDPTDPIDSYNRLRNDIVLVIKLFIKVKFSDLFEKIRLSLMAPSPCIPALTQDEYQSVFDGFVNFYAYNYHTDVGTITPWLKKSFAEIKFLPSVALDVSMAAYHTNNLCNLFEQTHRNSWNIVLVGHGMPEGKIAEFGLDEFHDFLLFLNEKITTATLTYKSCNSGGINRVAPFFTNNPTPIPLDLNFTVICCNVGNLPVLATITEYAQKGLTSRLHTWNTVLTKLCHEVFDLDVFFANIEHYQNEDTTRRSSIMDAVQGISPSLKTGELYKKMTHIPQVRFPHTAYFVFIPTPDVAIVEEDALVAFINLENKKIVILSSPLITSALLLRTKNTLPAFISHMPTQACHIFSGAVETCKSLTDTIRECFFYHPRKTTHSYCEVRFTQLFLLEQITTLQSAELTVFGKSTEPKETTLSLPAQVYKNIYIILTSKDSSVLFFLNDAVVLSGTLTNDETNLHWEVVDTTEADSAYPEAISPLCFDIFETIQKIRTFATTYPSTESFCLPPEHRERLLAPLAHIADFFARKNLALLPINIDKESAEVEKIMREKTSSTLSETPATPKEVALHGAEVIIKTQQQNVKKSKTFTRLTSRQISMLAAIIRQANKDVTSPSLARYITTEAIPYELLTVGIRPSPIQLRKIMKACQKEVA